LYFAGQLKVGINATPISGGLVLSTFASFKMIVVKSESEIKL